MNEHRPMLENKRQISKEEFDSLAINDMFSEGPYVSTFGDGYGEPYNPNREAWGKLDTGEIVWAWVQGPKSEEGNKHGT